MIELVILAVMTFLADALIVSYTLAVASKNRLSVLVLAGVLESIRQVSVLIVTDVRGSAPVLVASFSAALGSLAGLYIAERLEKRKPKDPPQSVC